MRSNDTLTFRGLAAGAAGANAAPAAVTAMSINVSVRVMPPRERMPASCLSALADGELLAHSSSCRTKATSST